MRSKYRKASTLSVRFPPFLFSPFSFVVSCMARAEIDHHHVTPKETGSNYERNPIKPRKEPPVIDPKETRPTTRETDQTSKGTGSNHKGVVSTTKETRSNHIIHVARTREKTRPVKKRGVINKWRSIHKHTCTNPSIHPPTTPSHNTSFDHLPSQNRHIAGS